MNFKLNVCLISQSNKKNQIDMKYTKFLFSLTFLLITLSSFSQENPERKKIKITGKIIDKATNKPLEYATISVINLKNPKMIFGAITDDKGGFVFDANAGMYTVKIEFISFKSVTVANKLFKEDTDLGVFSLLEDTNQLQEVVVRNEKTSVEIKLDKKVYNVGKDILIKGGTVSDVLDNIPSVAVDAEGTVSVRGNENVRILIDGKPSNANNINEALKLIPADAIDKVEVITNPSARYDAEGGAGILNIILKKGKTNGLNGTVILTAGTPKNTGFTGTFNFKSEKFNLFSTLGFADRSIPGNARLDTDYLNPTPSNSTLTSNETRKNDRFNKVSNASFGVEYFLTNNTTWTNSFSYQKKNGLNVDNSNVEYSFINSPNKIQNRISNEDSNSENLTYSSNLIQKFKKEGHKLSFDYQYSFDVDRNLATITDNLSGSDFTKNFQNQSRNLFQADYVLPFGKDLQFEAGYRGDFSEQTSDILVLNGIAVNNSFTQLFQYKEKVNALYSQFGFKKSKFSFLFGLRFEDSNIDVNRLTSNLLINKKYNNLFPSAFVTYEINDKSSISLSYSKRISRPRGRQLNPFNNYSSNINIFQGNVDINPALTDALDFGYIKRWDKVIFNTSLYVNKTNDVFQFIRRPGDLNVNGVQTIISTPINLDKEYRLGFEFTLNYSPYKWWKLNSNFNFFRVETIGDYKYTTSSGNIVTNDFGNIANSWSTRLTSKVTLPYKIDWQTNASYNGPQTNAQGLVKGVFGLNLGFSKDILKDKGSIAVNVSDVFNSRKRYWDTQTTTFRSAAEMQMRERQITLSFTYRFNKSKNDKEKPKKPQQEGGEDYQG